MRFRLAPGKPADRGDRRTRTDRSRKRGTAARAAHASLCRRLRNVDEHCLVPATRTVQAVEEDLVAEEAPSVVGHARSRAVWAHRIAHRAEHAMVRSRRLERAWCATRYGCG